MPANTLTITDNRTGKSYEVPIEHDTIKADALRQIKVNPSDFGMMTYDPAFMNTASCKSAITYIDGDAGILQYRGIPIEQLAEQSTYLETAYLIMYGELPNKEQLATWTYEITHHTFLHENIKQIMQAFRYDAHPMGMFISIVAPLCPPSIPKRATSKTRKCARSKSIASSPKCRPSPPSPIAIIAACRTSTLTTI